MGWGVDLLRAGAWLTTERQRAGVAPDVSNGALGWDGGGRL